MNVKSMIDINKDKILIISSIITYGLLDLVTTYLALVYYGLEELNPLMRYIQTFFQSWFFIFIICKLIIISFAFILYYNYDTTFGFSVLLVLGVYVTTGNSVGILLQA
jgi:hypothetical protein